MKGMFVEFVRLLRDPVRARRQEKIREVELTWSDHDLSNFRVFAMGLQPAEMADVCHALADATAIPLLEVLVDYTGVNNELMILAFQSLEKVPASARLFLSDRLLASANPVVRAGTCAMLGGVGVPAADPLTSALGDQSALVEAAAIRSLVRLGNVDHGARIVPLLRSESEGIRSLALDSMIAMRMGDAAFAVEALRLYEDGGEKPAIRQKAAKALAAMRNADGKKAMLRTLFDSSAELESRRIAAEALGAFTDKEVVAALLRAVREEKGRLAETAGRALTGMEPAAIIPVLAAILRDKDVGMAMAAADLLGNMQSSRAAVVLGDCLAVETRPPVVAVIADVIGKSGAAGAWKVLHRKLLKDNPESMSLLSSLADSAREENLDDFALLLDRLPESGAGELVLRRLAAFSRTVKPSPTILNRALSVLDSGNRGLAIPAVEILVYSGEESLRVRILTEIACIGPEMPTRRLLREMLRFKSGELAALFKGVGPETAWLVEDAAAEADSLGKRGEDLFRKMAAWAREGVKGAVSGMREAVRLDPAQLVAAMKHSPHQVYLLDAWSGLNQRDRINHPPDLDSLFIVSDVADRLAVLAILSHLGEERYLRSVAMVAFSDGDTGVREAAVELVRKLVGTDS